MPTRGFLGRGKGARDPRLPPGQYDTGRQWPVLTAEATPKLDTATWSFAIEGLVDHPVTWTWDEIHALPPSTYSGDIHCVTTWSKLGMTFTGVSIDTLLEAAGPKPAATHEQVLRIARDTARKIGVTRELTADDVELDDRYHAGTYGIPDATTLAAIRTGASLEGMITDPVYEGKSLAGMIDLVRRGEIGRDANVLYAHIGGQPALNAYAALFT